MSDLAQRAANSPVGPWMDLLGAVLSQLRTDAIQLRKKGYLDPNGEPTPKARYRFRPRHKYGVDLDAIKAEALAEAQAMFAGERKSPGRRAAISAAASRLYREKKAAAVSKWEADSAPRSLDPKGVLGIGSLAEVDTIGRMIYRGGLDHTLARLGLEPFGWQVKQRVEREVAKGGVE